MRGPWWLVVVACVARDRKEVCIVGDQQEEVRGNLDDLVCEESSVREGVWNE